MSEKGRHGISGKMRVKVAFEHKGQGKTYAVGDFVEGHVVDHHGKIVFEFYDENKPEFIDPEKINPANLDRSWGVQCVCFIANYCSGIVVDDNGDDRKWSYDKGDYLYGKLMELDGKVCFDVDGLHLRLELFQDEWEGLETEGWIGYEIEEVPRFFNALG
jgi:hypothetical protein